MERVGTPKPRFALRFLPMNASTRSCRSPQVGGASPKFSRGSHAGGTVGLQMRCLRHEY